MTAGELKHLRSVLELLHDEIHHPGAARTNGEDIELLTRSALLCIGRNMKQAIREHIRSGA